jgi:hypothetical protein
MPGLVPGIHVLPAEMKAWMAGPSPAMTRHFCADQAAFLFPPPPLAHRSFTIPH